MNCFCRIKYIHPVTGNSYYLRSFALCDDGRVKPVGVLRHRKELAARYSVREGRVWVAFLLQLGYDAWAVFGESELALPIKDLH